MSGQRARATHVPAPSRAYWFGQGMLGAALLLLGIVARTVTSDEARIPLLRSLLVDIGFAVTIVAVTHALRPVVLRDVAALGTMRARVWRRLAALLALGLVSSAIDLTVQSVVLERAGSSWPPSPSSIVSNGFTWGFAFAAWCVAYGTGQLVVITSRAAAERVALLAAAREAEARALRAQMDPHFLFNAINSARALVGVDPDGARDLLTRYAEVLRYVLTRTRGTSVTLGEELDVAQAYLEIERQRFPGRLRAEVDVPAELRHVAIPPLLLQTLVENAVRHGISRLAGGGTVGIRARSEGGAVVLIVRNPAPRTVGGEVVRGIGLENSRARLQLMHGEASELSLSRDPEGVVTVRLRVPMAAAVHGAGR